ncbi:hypothetical protein HSB1_35820 [Halogranum salarium B-1]|uniref:Uncharacterized protein n=1 Tax=Halogranum salarium B-1 TaxID=1210908 RepID=J2ZBY9_9EURY|nr:hypothetical protein HSB1_35820 [Halogranum salarium B-1]
MNDDVPITNLQPEFVTSLCFFQYLDHLSGIYMVTPSFGISRVWLNPFRITVIYNVGNSRQQ